MREDPKYVYVFVRVFLLAQTRDKRERTETASSQPNDVCHIRQLSLALRTHTTLAPRLRR